MTQTKTQKQTKKQTKDLDERINNWLKSKEIETAEREYKWNNEEFNEYDPNTGEDITTVNDYVREEEERAKLFYKWNQEAIKRNELKYKQDEQNEIKFERDTEECERKKYKFLYDEEKREIEFERDTEECEKTIAKCEEDEFEENCKKITEDLEPNYNTKLTPIEKCEDIVKAFNNEIYTKWVEEYLYKLKIKLMKHHICVSVHDEICVVINNYGIVEYGYNGRFGKEMHICRKDRKRIKKYRSMSLFLGVVFCDYAKKFKFD